jgi:hypothetical protein
VSKFIEGAWLTAIMVPAVVIACTRIRRHYREVSEQLTMRGLPPDLRPCSPPRVVVPISGVHRGMVNAVCYAQSISPAVTAVYIELEPGSAAAVRRDWQQWWPGVPLDVVPSPYRSIIGPLLAYLERTDQEHNDGASASVILPEFVPARWWQNFLHNQSAWMIKAALLYSRRRRGSDRIIIDVPHHLRR